MDGILFSPVLLDKIVYVDRSVDPWHTGRSSIGCKSTKGSPSSSTVTTPSSVHGRRWVVPSNRRGTPGQDRTDEVHLVDEREVSCVTGPTVCSRSRHSRGCSILYGSPGHAWVSTGVPQCWGGPGSSRPDLEESLWSLPVTSDLYRREGGRWRSPTHRVLLSLYHFTTTPTLVCLTRPSSHPDCPPTTGR